MNEAIIMFELVFVAAVALGFGAYQLHSVSREIRADKRRLAMEDHARRTSVPHDRGDGGEGAEGAKGGSDARQPPQPGDPCPPLPDRPARP